MNIRILLAATAAIVLSLAYASARTWTSSDGKRRFEGELKSYDAGAGIVTVVLANGQEIRFTLDKLSVEDRDFLSKGSPAITPGGNLPTTLAREGVLKILKDGRLIAHKLDPQPRYYLLYFSASW